MAHRQNTKKMYTKPTLTCTISIIKTLVLLASKNAVSRILIHTVSYTTLTHNSIYYQKSLERQQFKERRLLLLAQKVVCEAISHLRTKCFLMQIARLGWGGFLRLLLAFFFLSLHAEEYQQDAAQHYNGSVGLLDYYYPNSID